MLIISHRGFWKEKDEQNTLLSFQRSFENGYGIETDIRDYKGNLVISHDVPDKNAILLSELLHLHKSYQGLKLALNIKSDGLQDRLYSALNKFDTTNYFLFDMSIPDGLEYIEKDLKIFTRQSEYEKFPAYLELSEGVWLDEFHSHWVSNEVITDYLTINKDLCIVSPELHGRDYKNEWSDYKKINFKLGKGELMLCTDFPDSAKNFFNE
jgi:hypothetical protein